MEDITVKIIESSNQKLEYEKALHRSFSETYPEYAEQFFNKISNNRLQPKIPYNDQLIFGVYSNGNLISGGSFCINIEQEFEIEKMGFKIEKTQNICEGLHFFSEIAQKVSFNMEIYRKLNLVAFDELKRRGIDTIYSSCAKDRLIMYKFIGFKVIDEIEYTGEVEYLIKRYIEDGYENNLFDSKRMFS